MADKNVVYTNDFTGEFSKDFQKAQTIKGGVLADDAGLGKTVTVLSLLVD